MIFKRLVNSVSLFCLTVQSVIPAYATHIPNIEDISIFWREGYAKSMPSALGLPAEVQRTAAGVLHYSIYEGTPYVLLGLRRDFHSSAKLSTASQARGPENAHEPVAAGRWCNLGGASDAADLVEGEEYLSLARTASREVSEESNGFYIHHPRLLRRQPYIDVFNGELLYRTYFQKVRYINPELLMSPNQDSRTGFNEYEKFQWVRAQDLLEALLSESSTIRSQDGEDYDLYPAMVKSLSTEGAITILKQIVDQDGRLQSLHKQIRDVSGKIYFVGQPHCVTHANVNLHQSQVLPPLVWPKIEVNVEEIAHQAAIQARKNAKLSLIPVRPVQQIDENKEEFSKRLERYHQQKNHALAQHKEQADNFVLASVKPETVLLETPFEKAQLAETVANHVAALIEYKRHHQNQMKLAVESDQLYESNQGARNAVTRGYRSDYETSITDIFLHIVLGPDYKSAADFCDRDAPQDSADEENIQLFLERFYSNDSTNDMNALLREGKRPARFIDSDVATFKRILQDERLNKDWPTFFHATTGSLAHLYVIFTMFNEFVKGSPLNKYVDMRGIRSYFDGINTIQDILSQPHSGDYSGGRPNTILCANMVEFAGLTTTRSSSSSIEYFLNDHSVRPPSEIHMLERFFGLAGMAHVADPYFRSLFDQYLAHNNTDYSNSVLLAVRLNPAVLDTYTYAAFGGGKPYNFEGNHWPKKDEVVTPVDSLHQLYEAIYALHENQKNTNSEFQDDIERKRSLFSEVRILLHPALMHNPDLAKVQAYHRFPLSQEEQSQFDQIMRQTMNVTIAQWLAEEGEAISGTFEGDPLPKSLYKMVLGGLTGQEPRQQLVHSGFLQLIHLGQVHAARAFFESCKHRLSIGVDNYQVFVRAALHSNSSDMLDFVFDEVFKESSQTLITFDQMLKWARLSWDGNFVLTHPWFVKRIAAMLPNDPANKETMISPFSWHCMKNVVNNLNNTFFSKPRDVSSYLDDFAGVLEETDLPHIPEYLAESLRSHIVSAVIDQWGNEYYIQLFKEPQLKNPMIASKAQDLLVKLIKKVSFLKEHEVFDYIMGRITDVMPSFANKPCVENHWILLSFLKEFDPTGTCLQNINPATGSPYVFDLLSLSTRMAEELLAFLAEQPWFFEIKDQQGRGILSAAQHAVLRGYSGHVLEQLLPIYRRKFGNLEEHNDPLFILLLMEGFKEDRDRSHEAFESIVDPHPELALKPVVDWVSRLQVYIQQEAPYDEKLHNLMTLARECPDSGLLRTFKSIFAPLTLKILFLENSRKYRDKPYSWLKRLKTAIKAEGDEQMRGSSARGLADNPFEEIYKFAGEQKLSSLMNNMRSFLGLPKLFSKEIGSQNPDENIEKILHNLPLSICEQKNLKQLFEGNEETLEKLMCHDLYKTITLSQIGKNKVYRDTVAQPWLDELRQILCEQKDVFRAARHLQLIPELAADERIKAEEILWRSSIDYLYTPKVGHPLRESVKNAVKNEDPEALARYMANLFPSAADFEDFLQTTLSSKTWYMDEVFIVLFDKILTLRDPAPLLMALAPYLTSKTLKVLTMKMDNISYSQFLRTTPYSTLETLVDSIPQLFCYHMGPRRDYFGHTLLNMQPRLLQKLLAKNPEAIAEMREGDGFIPYFTCLLTKDSLAPVVADVLRRHPDMLERYTLDEMTLLEYAEMLASPAVLREIRKFMAHRHATEASMTPSPHRDKGKEKEKNLH